VKYGKQDRKWLCIDATVSNLTILFLGTLLIGFLAGIGVYQWHLETAQIETISRRELQELRARNDSPPSLPMSDKSIEGSKLQEPRAQNDSTVQPKKKLLSCSLRTVPNATPTNVEAIINSIHDELKVRALTAIESGKSISQTPSGTYFYFEGYELTKSPNNSISLNERGVRRRSDQTVDYELINLGPESILLIAFAGPSEAAAATVLDGTTPRRLTLFPQPSSEASVLLTIPLERIMESSYRSIQPDTPGRILVLDVVLN
jgi:hypothetical protein